MVKASSHGHMFGSSLPASSCQRILNVLTDAKVLRSDGEIEEVEVEEAQVFRLERTPLLSTAEHCNC